MAFRGLGELVDFASSWVYFHLQQDIKLELVFN